MLEHAPFVSIPTSTDSEGDGVGRWVGERVGFGVGSKVGCPVVFDSELAGDGVTGSVGDGVGL